MKITSLNDLSEADKRAISASVSVGEYNLFLGAGVSLDSTGADGDLLPSGETFRTQLVKVTEMPDKASLQRAYSALKPDQVEALLTKRFAPSKPGPSLNAFPTFIWKRVFTLNIDDAFEAAYNNAEHPLQKADPAHFVDSYSDPRSMDILQVVHLHGFAPDADKGYVFSRSEYAETMAGANAWMSVLAEIMPVEPFVVAGTMLDEIDLSYYLAKRTSQSPRQDKGPSFLVEPYPDKHTEREAGEKGLVLYHGFIANFLKELDAICPNRRAPHELVAPDIRALFPDNTPAEIMMGFASDFDAVPNDCAASTRADKFAYGHPPEWSDLEGNWDVGRHLTARAVGHVDAMLSNDLPGRVLLIEDASGTGKTTVLRRLAYQLSKRGVVTLNCSSLSRLEPSATVAAFDLIDAPVVVIVDNFADQAQAVNNTVELTKKRDLVFVGAERSYRHNHIQRSFGSSTVKSIDGLSLTVTEAGQLVDAYDKRGALVNSLARSDRKAFLSKISTEPIAMACCHILNDMRPIDSIVDSVMADVGEIERNRFYVAALARICFPGGIKYEVLSAASSRANWDAQFDPRHPAPLSFFEGGRDYVVPLNVTLAERALERAPREVLLRIFGRLATAIAPRVNRESIKRRVPEAKIAGRLFDYDDIIKKYLGDKAEQFYESARQAWRWNSRYWEQLSLFYLSRYRVTKSEAQLDAAVQHARHAVSIERHAFSLTTLAKVLLTQANDRSSPEEGSYSEAVKFLVEAIGIERNRGRASVHAYVTLFRGSVAFIEAGGEMSEDNYRQVSRLLVDAREFFSGDRELRTLREQLEAAI